MNRINLDSETLTPTIAEIDAALGFIDDKNLKLEEFERRYFRSLIKVSRE